MAKNVKFAITTIVILLVMLVTYSFSVVLADDYDPSTDDSFKPSVAEHAYIDVKSNCIVMHVSNPKDKGKVMSYYLYNYLGIVLTDTELNSNYDSSGASQKSAKIEFGELLNDEDKKEIEDINISEGEEYTLYVKLVSEQNVSGTDQGIGVQETIYYLVVGTNKEDVEKVAESHQISVNQDQEASKAGTEMIANVISDIGGELLKYFLQIFVALGDGVTSVLNQFSGVTNNYKIMYQTAGEADTPNDVNFTTDTSGDAEDGQTVFEISNETEDDNGKVAQFKSSDFKVAYIPFSVESMIKGQGLFNVNFLVSENTEDTTGIWLIIRDIVAAILRGLITITMAILLAVLIWKAIKIITNSLKEETSWKHARDKQILMDWVIAFAKLMSVVFIMGITVNLINSLATALSGESQFNIKVIIDGIGSFNTNFMGLIRTRVQSESAMEKLLYTILYLATIVATVRLAFVYVKRMLTMAILTIIAPISILLEAIRKKKYKDRKRLIYIYRMDKNLYSNSSITVNSFFTILFPNYTNFRNRNNCITSNIFIINCVV